MTPEARRPIRVFLNPGATHGTGRERWARVEGALRERLGDLYVEETVELAGMKRRLAELVALGESRFVAVGGDGTVNLLANAIMALPEGAEVALGAVGTGSSNDFHKPYGDGDTIEGMPVHIDFDSARPRDVIQAEYEQPDGSTGTTHAIINASVGVTAEANRRFNEPGRVIRAARAMSVDAAITAAVVTTLATWVDVTCAISTDGEAPEMVSVTNLSVFKNPHFGGALCYDTTVPPDDGTMGVALCEGMSSFETVATLSALRKRRFKGRRKTRSWTARTLSVHGDRPLALETDGEVVAATSVRFEIASRKIDCCA